MFDIYESVVELIIQVLHKKPKFRFTLCIISYISKVDEIDKDAGLLDWFSKSLDINGKRYKKLFENGFPRRYYFYETI